MIAAIAQRITNGQRSCLMKKIYLAALSAAGLALAGAAQAQVADWTGPYIAAHAGYATDSDSDDERVVFDTNLDGTFNDQVNTAAGANAFSTGFCGGYARTNAPGGGCTEDDKGFEFGVRLGYDWQFGPIVIGALAEISRTDGKDSVSAFSTTPAAYNFSRKLHALGALRLRGGYAFGDNLVYGTGGVARGDFKRSFATTNTANRFTIDGGDDPQGYQLGAGVERRLTPDVTVGVEYLYTKLDDDGYVVRAQGPVAATNPFILVNAAGTDMRRAEEKFDFHSVRVTASYRF
jgi:outer membrane immunogenic protein